MKVLPKCEIEISPGRQVPWGELWISVSLTEPLALSSWCNSGDQVSMKCSVPGRSKKHLLNYMIANAIRGWRNGLRIPAPDTKIEIKQRSTVYGAVDESRWV